MKNVKLSTRIIAALVILFCIGGLFLLQTKLFAPMKSFNEVFGGIFKVPAKNISISLNKQGLIPFDLLMIDGKNFDPSAATSVIFTSREKQIITVPALSVTPTAVAVSVPPLGYNAETGKFNLDVVSFRVVQVKKDGTNLAVKTSNEIAGIQVLAPAVPKVLQNAGAKKIPVGAITRAFVARSALSLQNAAKNVPASSTTTIASLNAAQKGMKDLLSSLDKFIKNPQTPVKLKTGAGETVNLDAAGIKWLDAFYAGYLGLAEQNQLAADKKDSFSLLPAAQAAGNDCPVDWESGEDTAYLLTGELGCFLDKYSGVTDNAIKTIFDKSSYNSNFVLILPTVALGIATGGFSIEAQIAISVAYSIAAEYAFSNNFSEASYLPGILTSIADGLLEFPKGFPLVSVLTLALQGFEQSCLSEEPGICARFEALLNEYGDKLLYLANGIPGMVGYLLDTPDENLNGVLRGGIGLANGGYDTIQAVITSGLNPSPAPVPGPTPIKVVPSPGPNPKPVPPPPGPSCEQKKEAAYTKCVAGCGNQQDCYTAYDECTPGCGSAGDLIAKSNCINSCLGALSKCTGASAKCFTDCLNAESATQCP